MSSAVTSASKRVKISRIPPGEEQGEPEREYQSNYSSFSACLSLPDAFLTEEASESDYKTDREFFFATG